MIQLVIGAAAGYVFGTKAGRRRYEQIRRGYEAAVNSPATRRAVQAGRKALADRLDPDPRMRELRDLRGSGAINGDAVLENDAAEHEEDIYIEGEQPRMRDSKGRPVSEQDGNGAAVQSRFDRFTRRHP
nr:hypothetical protein [Corynebacterium sp.]